MWYVVFANNQFYSILFFKSIAFFLIL